MVGSHVEDVSEQDRGRDPSPPTQGRKNKSRDTISNFEGQIVKIDLGVVDTKVNVDFLEQRIEETMENLRGRSRTFKRGCQARRFTQFHSRSSWLFKTRS